MQQPPRTLFFGLNYPPETTGISPYTAAMAAGLVRRGHHVRAVVAHPHYPEWEIAAGYGQWSKRESINGVALHRVRHFVPRHPAPLPRALSEVTLGLRQVFTRWGRPSSVITVSPALLSSAILRLRALLTHSRTPFVVWVQDLYALGVQETGQGGGAATRLIRSVEGWLLRSATTVVVIHERFAKRVHEDFGVPMTRIRVVRNWTHLSPFPPADVAAVRRAYGWSDEEIVVVHAGNMGVKQGLEHVVNAGRLAYHQGASVRFVLFGEGSQRVELQRRVDDQPTTTQIVPPLDNDAFGNMLQSADILLVNELPGVAEMAVPSKLTSYFASGRPVLAATDSTGITAQEVHAARAGIVVPAGDPAALLAGVERLVADRQAAARLGANGRRYRETVLAEASAVQRFDSLLSDLTSDDAAKHRV